MTITMETTHRALPMCQTLHFKALFELIHCSPPYQTGAAAVSTLQVRNQRLREPRALAEGQRGARHPPWPC